MSTAVYNCPACGGPLSYNGTTNKLECSNCGNTYDAEAFEVAVDEGKSNITFDIPKEYMDAEDLKHINAYVCQNCGAELMTDENTTASVCAYCGSPTIMPSAIESGVKPETVVPFKVSKEEAQKIFENYFKGKKLMPNIFLNSQNRITEMRKLYVPYWLFNCGAEAAYTFDAKKVTTRREGDYEVTKTDHYRLHRKGHMSFSNIPVDASEKLDDNIGESLEPFKYEEAVAFNPGVLAGALAENADVDADQCVKRAIQRVEASVDSTINSTVSGYTSYTVRNRSINTQEGKVTPTLFPVWLITTEKQEKQGKKTYTFAINGQTGELTCDVKPDLGKSWLWFFVSFLGSGVGLFLVLIILKALGVF